MASSLTCALVAAVVTTCNAHSSAARPTARRPAAPRPHLARLHRLRPGTAPTVALHGALETSPASPPPSPPPPRQSWGGRQDGDDDDDDFRKLLASHPLLLAFVTLSFSIGIVPWARRGARFWIGVWPILSSYAALALQTRCIPEARKIAAFAELHQTQAPRALELVQSLAGGYIKMGQVLSNRAGALPDAYVGAFSKLQDSVPQRPWSQMEAIVRRETPQLLSQVSHVQHEAVGAASTGQVHFATLLDGREVVIKIQYPEARGRFKSDFGNVARLMRLAIPSLVPMVMEVRRRFNSEFDYEREAQDMAAIAASLSDSSVGGRVRVPLPLSHLSSSRVLVMEYLPGEKLTSAVERSISSALGKSGYAWMRARALEQPMPRHARAPSLLSRVAAAPKLWLLRAQTRAKLRLLLEASAIQIFRDGTFNGDPHPGNVLLCTDGKLGLIDYGQVARLSDERRVDLARLVLALSDPDGRSASAVAAAAKKLGFVSASDDPQTLARSVAFFFDRDDAEEPNPVRMLRKLHASDPLSVRVPEELVLVARVSLLLRGTAMLMAQQSLSTASMWRAEAERAVRAAELQGSLSR